MKFFGITTVCFLVSFLTRDCSCQLQCPNGAIKFQDYNCYQEIKNAVPQGDGAAACSTSLEGSKLVSIKYEAEQEVLVQLLEGRSFWTSGKRVESSSDFQWEDGTLASLGIWDEGEPGNEPGRDCLLVATNGKWKAVACDQPEFLMCQSQLSWNEDKLQDVLISLRHGLVDQNKQLHAAITNVGKQLNDSLVLVTTGIENAKIDIANLTTEFGPVKNNVDGIRTDVDEIERTLGGLDSRVSAIEGEVGIVTGDVEAVQNKADDAGNRTEAVEESLGGVETSVTNIWETLNTTVATVQNLSQSLENVTIWLDAVDKTSQGNVGLIAANKNEIQSATLSLVATNAIVDQTIIDIATLDRRVSRLENAN